MIRGSEAAFARAGSDWSVPSQNGMTIREHLAAQALQGLAAHNGGFEPECVANRAVTLADSVLAALYPEEAKEPVSRRETEKEELIAERDELLENLVDLLYERGLVTDVARREEVLLRYREGVRQVAQDFMKVVKTATVSRRDEATVLREAVYLAPTLDSSIRPSAPDPEDVLERLELEEMRRDEEGSHES